MEQQEDEYVKAIEVERVYKDEYFSRERDSPIPEEMRSKFSGLNYFPVEPKYRSVVRLTRYDNPKRVVMMTSKGTRTEYLMVGFFEFEIDGKRFKLQAYRMLTPHQREHEDPLFVPFRDRTSGVDTYESGRYLDVTEKETGSYELDFNRAYNPFCAYSENYVCPLPTKENWMDIEIRAGEKTFKKEP